MGRERKGGNKEDTKGKRGAYGQLRDRGTEKTDESGKDKVLESPTHAQRRPGWTRALGHALPPSPGNAQQDYGHGMWHQLCVPSQYLTVAGL